MDPLVEITARNQGTIFNDDPDEVKEGDFTTYGLGVTQPLGHKNKVFAYVSQNDRTTLAKLRLFPMRRNKVGFRVVATHDLPEKFELPNGTIWEAAQDDDDEMSHVEGIVVDDGNKSVYFGQEQVGIWKGPLKNTFKNLLMIDKVNEFGVPYLRTWNEEEEEYDIELLWDEDPDYGSDYLAEDVEGLTIYDAGDGEGYLIASSQGSNQFVVYDRKTNYYIGDFAIGQNGGEDIDSVQESDGAAVTNLNLGGDFESGLFVVQDGENTPYVYVYSEDDLEYEEIDNANFKYVQWSKIADAMGLVINNN
jgi:3-phytase